MKRESWNILANTFEIKTRGSYKKCYIFAEHHFAALQGAKANPAIAPIFAAFEPVYEDFFSEYAKWNGLRGTMESKTQGFTETLLTMQAKLKFWEGKIFFHYHEGTPEAETLFPHKRTPFYKGTHVSRVQAVRVLSKQLDQYPVLAAVKTDVEEYLQLLEGKLSKQTGTLGLLNNQSGTLEQKRKNICAEMYGNLGLLMHVYRHNTSILKAYFDMGVLKNRVHRKKKKDTKP